MARWLGRISSFIYILAQAELFETVIHGFPVWTWLDSQAIMPTMINQFIVVTVHCFMNLDLAFQNFGRLVELTKSEKKIFASLIQVVAIDRWDFLLAEGQICKYEYFVLKGCLRSFYLDANDKEHTTMFAVEGWWTGDLRSFHKNIPSSVAIEALEKSVVIRLSKTKLNDLYTRVPKFERYFRILLQNRLLANEDRLVNHLSSKASQSYKEFQTRYPNMEQRISQKYIASYLGITATYLSRIRKNEKTA